MARKFLLVVLCCLCVALPSAAQTAAPEGMVQIPAGNFWMGRVHLVFFDSIDAVPRDKNDDMPANNIYLDAFYIDKYEVTNADYAKFVQATGARAPWHWPEGKVPKGEERLPVYNVNWYEANEFCKWSGKRLPTEAEWEKAARGGLDRQRYSWGDKEVDTRAELNKLQQISARNNNTPFPAAINRDGAMPVGSFAPNGYGLYDMIGNVIEWTNDWYDINYYAFMPKRNPPGPMSGRYKSVRGGGWRDGDGYFLMNAYRNFSDPDLRMITLGMRCAK